MSNLSEEEIISNVNQLLKVYKESKMEVLEFPYETVKRSFRFIQ